MTKDSYVALEEIFNTLNVVCVSLLDILSYDEYDPVTLLRLDIALSDVSRAQKHISVFVARPEVD